MNPTTTTIDEPALPTFRRAVAVMRSWRPPTGVHIVESTAPVTIAPHAFALSAMVTRPGTAPTRSRLILLHEPSGHPAWQGTLRLVTHLGVDLVAGRLSDIRPDRVAWSWLLDGLTAAGARHVAAGGTITRSHSVRCGELTQARRRRLSLVTDETATDPADVTTVLELRASWTPLGEELTAHLDGWCVLLLAAAGSPDPGPRLLSA